MSPNYNYEWKNPNEPEYLVYYPDCKICGCAAGEVMMPESGCSFCPCNISEQPDIERRRFLLNALYEIDKMLTNLKRFNQPCLVKKVKNPKF